MTKTHYIIAALVIGLAVLGTAFDLFTAKQPRSDGDSRSAEAVIREYYGALGRKDAAAAQALLAPELQVLLPEETVAQGAAALDRIVITDIKKSGEHADLVAYETKFDVSPKAGAQTSFKNGENIRHIALVDIGDEWRISKIATDEISLEDPRSTQQILPRQINKLGHNSSYSFPAGTEISLLLDGRTSPKTSLKTACNPTNALNEGSDIASVKAPFYGIKFKAQTPGTCEVTADNFKTTAVIN